MSFITILILRLKSERPDFFKKIQKASIYVAAVVLLVYGLLWLDIIHMSAAIHEKLNTGCYAILTFITGVIFTAQTGTKDPNLVSSDTKDAVINANKNTTENT